MFKNPVAQIYGQVTTYKANIHNAILHAQADDKQKTRQKRPMLVQHILNSNKRGGIKRRRTLYKGKGMQSIEQKRSSINVHFESKNWKTIRPHHLLCDNWVWPTQALSNANTPNTPKGPQRCSQRRGRIYRKTPCPEPRECRFWRHQLTQSRKER